MTIFGLTIVDEKAKVRESSLLFKNRETAAEFAEHLQKTLNEGKTADQYSMVLVHNVTLIED